MAEGRREAPEDVHAWSEGMVHCGRSPPVEAGCRFPQGFPKLARDAQAAKLRTSTWEACHAGGLRCRRLAERIRNAVENTNWICRTVHLGDWLLASYAATLCANHCRLDDVGITQEAMNTIAAGSQRPWIEAQEAKAKQIFQKVVADRMRAAEPPRDVEGRLRSKLEHWQLDMFPRVMGVRAARTIIAVGRRAPPRVAAAVLRTWFDGWCTQRRLGADGPCIFCRIDHADYMEHLPHCRIVRDCSQRSLGLPTPGTPRERNTDFLRLGADEGDVLVLKADPASCFV